MIFHVVDVDAFWTHLKKIRIRAGYFTQDGSWGRTLFHMHDPDAWNRCFKGEELIDFRPVFQDFVESFRPRSDN
jgi:hypothetical protein